MQLFVCSPPPPTQKDELANLKALKTKLEAEAAAKKVALHVPSSPVPTKPNKSKTPTSLDDMATPNERVIYGKLKQHDAKLDGLCQMVRFAAAAAPSTALAALAALSADLAAASVPRLCSPRVLTAAAGAQTPPSPSPPTFDASCSCCARPA
jgi:hypothetical protein